jgi:hypothetical protein
LASQTKWKRGSPGRWFIGWDLLTPRISTAFSIGLAAADQARVKCAAVIGCRAAIVHALAGGKGAKVVKIGGRQRA